MIESLGSINAIMKYYLKKKKTEANKVAKSILPSKIWAGTLSAAPVATLTLVPYSTFLCTGFKILGRDMKRHMEEVASHRSPGPRVAQVLH